MCLRLPELVISLVPYPDVVVLDEFGCFLSLLLGHGRKLEARGIVFGDEDILSGKVDVFRKLSPRKFERFLVLLHVADRDLLGPVLGTKPFLLLISILNCLTDDEQSHVPGVEVIYEIGDVLRVKSRDSCG